VQEFFEPSDLGFTLLSLNCQEAIEFGLKNRSFHIGINRNNHFGGANTCNMLNSTGNTQSNFWQGRGVSCDLAIKERRM